MKNFRFRKFQKKHVFQNLKDLIVILKLGTWKILTGTGNKYLCLVKQAKFTNI
jgi:hypothetical protein